MSERAQDETVAFLSRPETYEIAGPVDRIDTHISRVFLAGDRVYKLKRAVAFPYLDYRKPEDRKRFCEAEVSLNRRTAPDMYLGIVPVTREADGSLALDGRGDPVDWLVEMTRFDLDALWDRLAETGRITVPMANDLADRVAEFHGLAAPVPGVDAAGRLAAVIDDENDPELRRFAPDVFDADDIAAYTDMCRRTLAQVMPLLAARAESGKIRHCHGDMHLANICQLDHGPVPFDAIEFSPEFASIDVLYDLAFVLMDLDAFDARPAANALLNRYLTRTRDYGGLAAMPLFIALRAGIRAHVTAGRAASRTDNGGKAALQNRARTYLRQALSAFEDTPPVLIAVGGLSGTGKSGLARALAADAVRVPGAVHLQSDAIRKRLAGTRPETPLDTDWYAEDVSERVHARMAEDARASVEAGYSVVLDATFMDPGRRDAVAALATRLGVDFAGVWLTAPDAVLESRVAARTGDVSDADTRVLRNQLDADIGNVSWRMFDTSDRRESVVEAVETALPAY